MIYFDAACIAKCYLNESGADRVREVANGADGLASCELARLEFASILKRHVRERHVTRREMAAILKDFEEDEQNGVWQWFGVTSELLEKARKAVLDLPSTVFVRSGDALHLACAEEHGFQEVYTNDRHMLQAAKHFNVTGVNVLDNPGGFAPRPPARALARVRLRGTSTRPDGRSPAAQQYP